MMADGIDDLPGRSTPNVAMLLFVTSQRPLWPWYLSVLHIILFSECQQRWRAGIER